MIILQSQMDFCYYSKRRVHKLCSSSAWVPVFIYPVGIDNRDNCPCFQSDWELFHIHKHLEDLHFGSLPDPIRNQTRITKLCLRSHKPLKGLGTVQPLQEHSDRQTNKKKQQQESKGIQTQISQSCYFWIRATEA